MPDLAKAELLTGINSLPRDATWVQYEYHAAGPPTLVEVRRLAQRSTIYGSVTNSASSERADDVVSLFDVSFCAGYLSINYALSAYGSAAPLSIPSQILPPRLYDKPVIAGYYASLEVPAGPQKEVAPLEQVLRGWLIGITVCEQAVDEATLAEPYNHAAVYHAAAGVFRAVQAVFPGQSTTG